MDGWIEVGWLWPVDRDRLLRETAIVAMDRCLEQIRKEANHRLPSDYFLPESPKNETKSKPKGKSI